MKQGVDLIEFHKQFFDSLEGPLSDLLDLREEAQISLQIDQTSLQDSFRYRAKRIGLKIASFLIDEGGELNSFALKQILSIFLKGGIFLLGPGREGDLLIYRHIQNCLEQLARQEKEIWSAIRKFSPPLCHRKGEEIIRHTLWPEPIRRVEAVHIRKAALAAWLTFLRQTTGSCFATAPALLIQQKEPFLFFKDLYDLLSTGQMKRTVGGKQYSVPFNVTFKSSDLQKRGVGAERSFGFFFALQAAGYPNFSNLESKVKELGSQTVEKMFESILLEMEGLTEEDLRNEEYLSRIQMTPLLAKQSAVYYQKPTERGMKVANWKKKVELASIAFSSLTDCPLLRAWEYSIASFSDLKTEFARWNLYIGIGLHPDQKGGIGAFLYEKINEQLQRLHREIDQLSNECEQGAAAIRALETMLQGTGAEPRANQLKGEIASHHSSLRSSIETRNRLIEKADGLAQFFPSLIQQYDEKLEASFQELFDPSLAKEEGDLYEDSSAGFRLVYKHGRADASQWTPIYDQEEYIDALRDFFSHVENELVAPPSLDKEMISELTTALIQFIQKRSFIESALFRSKEKGRKSPWDYISGGTLQTLASAYWSRTLPFSEAKIAPRSEEELLHFLQQIKNKGPLLIHSPTHAFIFYPDLLEGKTLKPGKKRGWSEPMQEHIAHRVSDLLPEEEKALFIHLFRQQKRSASPIEFRLSLIQSIGERIKQKETIVDSVLYEHFSLFTQTEAKEALRQIFRSLGRAETGGSIEGAWFSSFDLYQLAKKIVLKSARTPFFPIDWDQKIGESIRSLGFGSDALLFGDTNWSGWFFGFVPHPATGKIELWRLNRTATQGFPMTDWKEWMNGTHSSPWVVLEEPKEYTGWVSPIRPLS